MVKKNTVVKQENLEYTIDNINILNEPVKIDNKTVKLSSLKIDELLDYEKACYLLCTKYEKDALILMSDKTREQELNDAKYKLYKDIYYDIFDEIEKRIIEISKS